KRARPGIARLLGQSASTAAARRQGWAFGGAWARAEVARPHPPCAMGGSMPRHSTLLAATAFAALLAACSEPGQIGPPEPSAATAARAGEKVRRVEMHDACD